ncbi:MAG: flavoprotein [Bdellovibrionota bacterium]
MNTVQKSEAPALTPQRPPHVLLGVTGSTAASKAQAIALALLRSGCEVRAAMTPSSQQFIQPMLLASVLKDPVYSTLWSPTQAGETHVEWARWADAMVIAPATATCIADLWLGAYNNPVTLLAANVPPDRLFIAPGMAQQMWDQPAVRRNVAQLTEWGVRFLGPVTGRVASGAEGQRLMEPRDIAAAVCELRCEL